MGRSRAASRPGGPRYGCRPGLPTGRGACATRRRRPAPTGRRRSSPHDRWPRPRRPAGGRRPYGDPAPADVRGRPAGVSDLPWPHAGRRVHDPRVGDRPDPRAPPDPRRARGTPRAAEPPTDAGLREPGPVTGPTAVRRHHDLRVRTAPRRPATTRGRLACAAVPPRRHRGLRRPRPPPLTAARTTLTAPGRAAGHAAAPHAVLARSAMAPYVRRTVDRPRSKFPSRDQPDAGGSRWRHSALHCRDRRP